MSKHVLFWLVFCGLCFLVGLWLLPQTKVSWGFRLFWLVLGLGGIGFACLRIFRPQPLSPQQLQHIGLGHIVAQFGATASTSTAPTPSVSTPLVSTPVVRVVAEEPSRNVTRMERPRYFLAPPLPAEMMLSLLEQCIQLSRRALDAAEQQRQDQPLLLATYRGQGANAKLQRVISSLEIWGWTPWAERLRKTPPPEPHPDGGILGDPAFLPLAQEVQQLLQTHPLPDNPFTSLGIEHALDRRELDMLRQHPLTPDQQKILDQLHTLLVAGETRTNPHR